MGPEFIRKTRFGIQHQTFVLQCAIKCTRAGGNRMDRYQFASDGIACSLGCDGDNPSKFRFTSGDVVAAWLG